MCSPRRFPYLLAAIFTVVLSPARASEPVGPTLAGTVPEGALAFFETAGLSELIRAVRGSEVFQNVLASDDFKSVQGSKFFEEASASRRLAEFVLRMSIWEASDKLLGGRVMVAAYPAGEGEDPHSLLLVRPAQPSDWLKERVRTAPLLKIGLKRIDRRGFGENVAAYRTRGFSPTYFALHEGWIAVASQLELLQTAVAMQEPGGGVAFDAALPLRAEEAFRKMSARMGESHTARAFLDTRRLEETTGDRLGFPSEVADPVLALFLGGVVEMIEHSRFVGLTLNYGASEVLLKAGIDARAEEMAAEHRVFFAGGPGGGVAPPPEVPGYIGGFSLYRQFGDWYRARDEAVQAAIVPGLGRFESGVGDVLFGDEGVLGDRVAFVSANAPDGGIDPAGIKLPGFAFVVELRDPAGGDALLGPLFEAALEEMGDDSAGSGPWELVADEHAGVAVNFAQRAGDTMRPSAARVGDRWVLSSSRELCKRVVDHLQGAAGAPSGDMNFDLRFTELGTFFAANRDEYLAELRRQGRSAAQAEMDYANISKVIAGMERISGTSKTAADGTLEFTARGVFR